MAEEFHDAMEYIWEKVPKTKEGQIHYLPGDIPYLYLNGFVDTGGFTYQEWKDAFEDCKQADGTYLVSKNKFMSFRQYRYAGPVFEPFDAARLREGEWTDEELKKLYHLTIKPSCCLIEDIYWNSIKALKKEGLVNAKGNLMINKTVKKQLAYIVDRFPSPRRMLEREVSRLREQRETEFRQVTKNRDASKFTVGKLKSEHTVEQFKNLQSSQTAKSAPPALAEPPVPSIDIKKLRRPAAKIKG